MKSAWFGKTQDSWENLRFRWDFFLKNKQNTLCTLCSVLMLGAHWEDMTKTRGDCHPYSSSWITEAAGISFFSVISHMSLFMCAVMCWQPVSLLLRQSCCNMFPHVSVTTLAPPHWFSGTDCLYKCHNDCAHHQRLFMTLTLKIIYILYCYMPDLISKSVSVWCINGPLNCIAAI